jgi:predicted transposase YbfD/YdcC
VKGNQANLLKDIKWVAANEKQIGFFQETNTSRGREISRTVSVFEVHNEDIKQKWQGLKNYICVERKRIEKGKTSWETAYFISDLHLAAADFAQGIQKHWGIENRLHWVKDVIYKEDKNGINTGNGAIVASVCSTIAINIHRINKHDSIKEGQVIFRANVKELFNIIRT